MAGNLNAIGILATVVLTIVSLAASRVERISLSRGMIALLLTPLVAIAGLAFSSHLCDAGSAFLQWVIPSVGVLLVVSSVRNNWLRWSAAAVLAVAAVGLSDHMTELVHEPGYTGNRDRGMRTRTALLRQLGEYIAWNPAFAGVESDPGWARDVFPFTKDDAWRVDDHLESLPRVTNFWHSWLTGIYRSEQIPADVWFTGGKAADAKRRLEIRERQR